MIFHRMIEETGYLGPSGKFRSVRGDLELHPLHNSLLGVVALTTMKFTASFSNLAGGG